MVARVIYLPEGLDALLMSYAHYMGIKWDSVIVFALVRFLEVIGWFYRSEESYRCGAPSCRGDDKP